MSKLYIKVREISGGRSDVLKVGHENAISITKLAYNTCLNSSSKRQSTGAIRARVKEDLGISLTAQDVEKVRKALIKAFPWVVKYFYTGYGLRLMKLERDIALHVIESMHAKGVPCLSMHDSFLVPADFKEELEYAMKYWASHVTGSEAGRNVGFDHFKVK
ncbi:hypothetical protein [Pseudophaeobacter sp. A-200-2]|uniref:hypothetical protein n=1 Tax=Pseudophaeobacter sp. A-200-2 TaxID=3098145 RepID=UPI0034D4E07D